METYMNDNEEIEIDLFELFMELKRKIWVILGVAVLCAGAAGAFSAFVLTPQYTSTAMVYILSKETTLTSLADLQIGRPADKGLQDHCDQPPCVGGCDRGAGAEHYL